MHLLALSWDVDRPGWLDPSVHALARSLGGRGVSCEVVTLGTGPTSTARIGGVDVTWVAEAPPVLPPTRDYDVARVLATTTRTSAAAERRAQARVPDAVLAVGWQTAWTAATLRSSRGTPLVAHLDSTAPTRADGDLDEAGRIAAQVEWWLTYEARRVVTTSEQAARDLRMTYRLPAGKIDVVPAGASMSERPTAVGDGVTAIAPPAVVEELRSALPDVPITGASAAVGTHQIAVVLDDGRGDLALRAMAAGAAVMVPEDGPLRGLVHARRSGVRVTRDAVVETVAALVADPARCRRLGERARQRVAARHDWAAVADAHVAVAVRAREEEAALATRPDRPLRPLLLRSPLLGPVGRDS